MGSHQMTRSEFLKVLGAAAAGVVFLPGAEEVLGGRTPETAEAAVLGRAFPTLSIATGHSLNAAHVAAVTRAAIANLGGMRRFVHSGDIVVVKPNIYGPRRPEQACTTNPTVVATVVRECLKAGARQVKVMDNPCGGDHGQSYFLSGIGPAAHKAGAKVVQMSDSLYRSYLIGGKRLPRLKLYPDVVNADVLIDVPIAKDHGGEQISMACKNLMGCTNEPGTMHNLGNGQAIPDLLRFLKPDLIVLDAIRVRVSGGPGGTDPGDVRRRYTVLASTNAVCADAYATRTFLGRDPAGIAQLVNAHAMGLGEINVAKISKKSVKL